MATRNTSNSGHGDVDQTDGGDQSSRTAKIVILALLAVFLIGGVAAIVAAVGLFGSGNETVKTGEPGSVDPDPNSDDLPGASSTSTTRPAKPDGTNTTVGSDNTSNTTIGGDAGGKGLAGASTKPVEVPFPAQETALLKNVRVANQSGFDRVVFEFDGPLPGYVVKYVPGPLTKDPSDLPVSIKGDKFLVVTMNPASGVSLDGATYKQFYSGPEAITGPGTPIAEVVQTGDFEAVLTWAIGVNGEKPFKVSKLQSPTRLVIDVAR